MYNNIWQYSWFIFLSWKFSMLIYMALLMCLVRIDLLQWQSKYWDLLLQIHAQTCYCEHARNTAAHIPTPNLYIFTHPQVIIVLQKAKT